MEDSSPLTEARRKALMKTFISPPNMGQRRKSIEDFRKTFRSLYKYHDEMKASRKRASMG